jgi:hypothetical protein
VGKPRVVKENSNTRIVIEIDCESKAAPDLIWSHNNETIKNQGRYLIDVFDPHTGLFILVLEIDDVVPEDAGTYKCVAKNHKGESTTNVEVKLDGGKNEFSLFLFSFF